MAKMTDDGQNQIQQQSKEKLLPHIQNAYAMENQIVETLEKHVAEAADFPQIQSKINMHLEQTKQHRDRMEQCLAAYGESPSAIKGMGSSIMGNMAGAMATARPDKLARMARDEYVTEHLEIAAYILLITTAQACGDQQTIMAAEQNLRDEMEMQSWLMQNLPEVCLLSLQQEGCVIPNSAWRWAQQAKSMMTADGSSMNTAMADGSSMASTQGQMSSTTSA